MIKSSNAGPFVIPTAPSVGTAVAQSASANTLGTAVQMIASTAEADFIVGVTFEATTTQVPTYLCFQITTGVSTVVATVTIPIPFTNAAASTQIGLQYTFPFPIPVATATKISLATASSAASAISWNAWLIMHKQADLVDAGVNEQGNVIQWNSTNVAAPATAGIPEVNIKNAANVAWASGSLTSGVFAAGAINAASVNADTGLIIRANTCTAIASGSITLDAGAATAAADWYKDCWVVVTSGNGGGQARRISAYNNSTRVASITPNWASTPSGTPTFAILPAGYVDLGATLGTASTGQAGSVGIDWAAVANPTAAGVTLSGTNIFSVTTVSTVSALAAGSITATVIDPTTCFILRANTATASSANSLTLDAAASATDDLYTGCLIVAASGLTFGQTRRISAYNGTTKVATVSPAWTATPAFNSKFVIMPWCRVDLDAILGTASVGAAGSVGVDWAHVANPTTTVALTGTTIATSQVVASVSGAVGSVASSVTVGTNLDKVGYALSAAGVDSIVIESGVNLRQAISLCSAALCGVLSGAGTTSIVLKAANDAATTRITATVDSNHNRTALALNIPA